LEPGSKLATLAQLACRSVRPISALAGLGLGAFEAERIYAALDWLGEAQPRIERSLAAKASERRRAGCSRLTSTWSRRLALAHYGLSRDGKRDDPQIVFGLLCVADGVRSAVEVFAGNTADPPRWPRRSIARQRFACRRWCGGGPRHDYQRADRTGAAPGGHELIPPALATDCRVTRKRGPGSLTVRRARLIALDSARYSGEAAGGLPHPALAEGAQKRAELLAATEVELAAIAPARPGQIGLRVGRVNRALRDAQAFELNHETSFTFTRKQPRSMRRPASRAYVLRTNVRVNGFRRQTVLA